MDSRTSVCSDELYHYGIKGMKWGVRRTPEQLGHKLRYTSPGKETAKTVAKRFAAQMAAMIIPGFGLAYNARVVSTAARDIRNQLDGKNYFDVEGQPEKLSELKRKTVETTELDDMKKCNPRLGKAKGTVNNCGYCSVAMEMRSRGYDVRARRKAQGIVTEEYHKWFNDVDIKHPSCSREQNESRKSFVKRSYDNLCKEIEKYGEGSRGYVGVQYEKINSGHAMFWKVSNGRVTFYDGQNKSTHTDKIFSLSDPTQYSYARLDNLTLKNQITEAVISRDK